MAEGFSGEPTSSKESKARRFDDLEEQLAKLKRGTPEHQKVVAEMAALADNLSKWRFIISVTEPGSEIFLLAQTKVKELKKPRVQVANESKPEHNSEGINEQSVASAKIKINLVPKVTSVSEAVVAGAEVVKNSEYPSSGKLMELFGLISNKFSEFGVTPEDLLGSFSGYLRLNTKLANFVSVEALREVEYRNLEEKNGEIRFYVTVRSSQNRVWNRVIDLKFIDIKRLGRPAKGYHWMDYPSKKK